MSGPGSQGRPAQGRGGWRGTERRMVRAVEPPGVARFSEYPHADGGASSLRPQDHVGQTPRVQQVAVTTVDAYLGERGIDRVALVKLDVEGAEVEALERRLRLLARRARAAR